MNLQITEHIIRISIIAPSGRIDAFTAQPLRDETARLVAAGVRHAVVDLTEVTFLDSAGMAALVGLLKRTRQSGGDTRLVRPRTEAAMRILQLTKFDRVFELYDSPAAAVDGFIR